MFPIGFDLEAAVNDTIKKWNSGQADRLEKALQKRALEIKLKLNTKSLDNLDDVKKRLAQLKIEPITPETRIAIKELAIELKQLAKALEQVQKYSKTTQLGQQNFRNDVQMEKLRQANERLEIQKRRVALAEQKHADAMQRSAERSKQLGNEYQKQSSYLNNLLKKTAALWSLHQVSAFLTNIRQVTAEFELQKVSLGAIIQDQQRANQLFAEIKSFALTSPLKILDLTKYTKQVAAYGFETEKLFDTTKMLADISVGLGVDMSRLTLFLGQVFATGYLRASEVRQATEAGIPLVDKLAQKLTEANGKLVTAADVMDLISKRAISFEQVEEVFKDMTSAGGEFYNMQVKQSQTLFGMWSKLGDAAAIMYDQIGNTSVVNTFMKTTIGLVEKMMRNWQTTGRILSTLTVGIGTYVLMLKNAAVASKALSGTTALLTLAHKQEAIVLPKVIAARISDNTAKKISTQLTNVHTIAVLRSATATNVLSRAFWKLTAAMLANPWALAAAAIVAAGAALFHFIGNAETAAERAEKLNNSVASLKNLETTTGTLVETFNKLNNKTERTAEEEKKLGAVTYELAKQYSGAITAVEKFGTEIELSAYKLNQLYLTEKRARMDNTRHELEKTEQKITETEEKIARLQAQLQDGTKTVTVGGGITGYTQTITVEMSDEDKGKILQQIDEIRYGKDGQSGLVGLQQSAEAARQALGLIPSEAAQAVEKFGAWKKTLTTFRKQVGDIKVQLFDDSAINQFGSLEEALKKTAEEYKKNIALVKTYDDVLKSTTLTAEEKAKIEAEKAQADAMATLAKNALTYYNALSLLEEKSRGTTRTSDPRLQTLQQIANKMAEINKEYDELLKKEGQTKALADTQKLFASSFADMQKVANKYKFKLPAFEVPQTIEDVQKWYKAVMDNIKRLNLKNADKVLIELGFKRDKSAIDKQQKDIEAQIKELSDRISRTKTAREFYDKVLNLTGDNRLASKVAESIFGQNGSELRKALADQVRGMTGDIPLPDGIISADNIIDYKALRGFAEANKTELGNMYDELVKISDNGQRDLAKTYEGYLKDLEKAKSYSDKRIELARYTANKIAEINASTMPQEEKERLTAGYQERETQKRGEIEWEAFKDMPIYVQMFDDLDNASTIVLSNMKDKLLELQSVWGASLNPTQLKELQSRLNEIDAQLVKKNPFKALSDAMKEYRSLSKTGTQADAERGLTEATDRQIAAQQKLNIALNVSRTAQDKYNDAVSEYGADSEQAKNAKMLWDAAEQGVDDASKLVEQTGLSAKEAQRLVEAWKKVKDAIGLSLGEVFQIAHSLGDLAGGIGKLTEVFGGSEEDVQYWNDIASGLNEVTSGIENMVQASISGNPIGIVTSAITAIPNMISGFSNLFSAGKVKRANKEIKKQQNLLEQLEYTYERLEHSSDKLFGRDYIDNYNKRLENLQMQAVSYQKMYEAEKSKGKKKDKQKLKEYEKAYQDTMDEIADMQNDLVAKFTGSTRSDIARQMAQSWIDARASMSDTFAAIKSDYQDLIKNMIVEGAAARVVENALSPMWDKMDKMLADNDIDGAIDALVGGMDSALNAANNGMETLWQALEAKGYDMKKLLSDTDTSEYTGIAKSVSSATSEEINANTAALNTQNYYISHIDENVAAMYMLMRAGMGGETQVTTSAGWTDWQQQAMDSYLAIQRNTADTVVECRRAANACEEAVNKMSRVIKVKGATQGFNVFLNS